VQVFETGLQSCAVVQQRMLLPVPQVFPAAQQMAFEPLPWHVSPEQQV
jgi:hypothetical protein